MISGELLTSNKYLKCCIVRKIPRGTFFSMGNVSRRYQKERDPSLSTHQRLEFTFTLKRRISDKTLLNPALWFCYGYTFYFACNDSLFFKQSSCPSFIFVTGYNFLPLPHFFRNNIKTVIAFFTVIYCRILDGCQI